MRPTAVRTLAAAASTALLLGPARASAQLITGPLVADAAGDFVTGYAGPRNGDMDVLGANVFFDGSSFRFVSRHAGAIGTTAGALHVWGVNRGQGTARFGALAPGVLFDLVVVLNPNAGGTSMVNDLIAGTSTVLPVGAVSFSGSDLSAVVSAALLPTLTGGFARSAYTANLWPRVGAGNTAISDFAPDNSNLAVAVVPEPGTAALLLPAVGALAAFGRRRRTR